MSESRREDRAGRGRNFEGKSRRTCTSGRPTCRPAVKDRTTLPVEVRNATQLELLAELCRHVGAAMLDVRKPPGGLQRATSVLAAVLFYRGVTYNSRGWNSAVLAPKSVSELSSTSAPSWTRPDLRGRTIGALLTMSVAT